MKKVILTLLVIPTIITSLFSQQPNLPYSRNIQWVDLVGGISISTTSVMNTNIVNSPTVTVTSGTVNLNDTMINRVVIRDGSASRNLNVNTYNGIDVRLINNTGTLISETNPLAVNYSLYVSTYIEINQTATIKSSAGYLYSIIVGVAGLDSSLIIRDGTTKIAEIDTTSAREIIMPIRFNTNLNYTTTGTTPAKITIIYR